MINKDFFQALQDLEIQKGELFSLAVTNIQNAITFLGMNQLKKNVQNVTNLLKNAPATRNLNIIWKKLRNM